MKKLVKKIKINFFGIGCTITKYRVTKKTIKKMSAVAAKMGVSLEMALLDVEFFKLMGSRNCATINELDRHFQIEGLIDGYKNQIEIWVDGKRKRTIKNIQYENEFSLFPEYNVVKSIIKFKSSNKIFITTTETSIGLIKCHRFSVSDFDMDKLCFHLKYVEISEGNLHPIFHEVSYNKVPINSSSSDNVITNIYAIIE